MVPSPTPERSSCADLSPSAPKSPHGPNSLPPMPPLMSFSGNQSISGMSAHSPNTTDIYNTGLNLSTSSRQTNSRSNSGSPYKQSAGSVSSPSSLPYSEEKGSNPSTPSWLTALSGPPPMSQGQKRPPPAHSSNTQPPNKRQLLDKISSESPTSSNSNMSPLVGEYCCFKKGFL